VLLNQHEIKIYAVTLTHTTCIFIQIKKNCS